MQFVVEWLFTPGRNLCKPGQPYTPYVMPTVRIHSSMSIGQVRVRCGPAADPKVEEFFGSVLRDA
jgi:hypothetical protein